jgi:hypothetical protein
VGTSDSALDGGDGCEFYRYVVGELGTSGITLMADELEGEQQDRFTLPGAAHNSHSSYRMVQCLLEHRRTKNIHLGHQSAVFRAFFPVSDM